MPFAIGIEYSKKEVNVGTLLRSALNFGASMVFTIGRRYSVQCSDTARSERHIPVMHFESWDQYREHAPMDWVPVAVELSPGATPLARFVHPRRAVYLLGPEDGNLSEGALSLCKYRVVIPTVRCINVAVAGSIVMYDRAAKVENAMAIPA